MLSKDLYFIHSFDAKMHYSIYYSLLKIKDDDKIDFNDSVRHKTCNHRLGRWNFFVDDENYSCGVYHTLEVIRQSILSAKENNKNSVDIALVSTKTNADICYVFNPNEVSGNDIDIDELKKYRALPAGHNEECESNTKITKKLFFNVIKPVLEEMFKKTDYKITTKKFKDKTGEHSSQFLLNFKQD